MTKITENTTVSVSVLVGLVGGIFFITNIYFSEEQLAKAQTEFKADVSDQLKDLSLDVKESRRDIQEIKTDIALLKKFKLKEK